MCVSYIKLNGINKPSEFPITRCDDAISNVGYRSNKMWIISLDARQGYHQNSVHHVDREKLAFFAPDKQKIRSSSCHLRSSSCHLHPWFIFRYAEELLRRMGYTIWR